MAAATQASVVRVYIFGGLFALLNLIFLIIFLMSSDEAEDARLLPVILVMDESESSPQSGSESIAPLHPTTDPSKWFHPYPDVPIMAAIPARQRAPLRRPPICNHTGAVIGLGMFKTGTTSLNDAIRKLGYPCAGYRGGPSSCHFQMLYDWFPDFHDHDRFYITASDSIAPLFTQPSFENVSLLERQYRLAKSGYNFGDGPWLFMYPILDQWLPHSKYILGMRNSTWRIVNSDIKMYAKYHNTARQSITSKKRIRFRDSYNMSNIAELEQMQLKYEMSAKEFMMLVARRYELHNENVIRYFQSRGRMHDLLILNIESEEDPWQPIAKFLECDETKLKYLEFPHDNKGDRDVGKYKGRKVEYMIPRNYPFRWRDFNFTYL